MPKRCWFQFSLRSLLVTLTVACLWLGWRCEKMRRRDEVLSAISAMGGEASFDDAPSNGFPWRANAPWWVEFHQYSFVKHDGTIVWANKVYDNRTEEIRNSARVVSLNDHGLERVVLLDGLGALTIVAVPITDAGLKRLHNAAGLRFLRLSRTEITEAGVAELRKALPKCEIVAGFGRNRFGHGPISNF